MVNFLNVKVYQKLGEDVIFDCDVQSNPVPKVYWFKNQTRIRESGKYRFEIMENNFYRLFISVSQFFKLVFKIRDKNLIFSFIDRI